MSLGYLLVLFAAIEKVTGFNLDTRTATVYSQPHARKSADYFGFSVALHSYQQERWLVVGAPLSDVTSSSGTLLSHYGAAFKCNTAVPKICSLINIDNKPDENEPFPYNGTMTMVNMEIKSGQWLGGTVHSTGKDGKVLVCAPRYIHKGDARHEREKEYDGPKLFRWISGRCYLVRSNLSGVESSDIIQPCKKPSNNPYNGYCQVGFSADSQEENESVVIGMIGWGNPTKSIVYAGGFEKYSLLEGTFTVSPVNHLGRDDYMDTKTTNSKMTWLKRNLGLSFLDTRNRRILCYDVTTGHFTFPNSTDIAGGAPRSNRMKGKVLIYEVVSDGVIYKSQLRLPQNLQTGSYFGSTICAVDLNNDGYTDLLVGAPLFTEIRDEGRVYVYINNKMGVLTLTNSMTLVGDKIQGGRFGSAIASVGDLNRDGYHDVVIGAPYEGVSGEGAVYVYYGNKKGIETRPRQKIPAAAVNDTLRGFGYSISGAVDVDGNGYPDVAIGSYASGHAVLLKTRRIVELEASIRLSRTEVVLENSKFMCDEADGTKHKCLNVTICFQYADRDPSNRQGLKISYVVEIEKDKRLDDLRRMYFYNNTEKSFSISRQYTITRQRQLYCLPAYTVHIRSKHQILDLLQPLTFDINFSLADTSCLSSPDVPCPVLDALRPTSVRNAELFIQKQCKGKVCKPDLVLKGRVAFPGNHKVLHIGSTSGLAVELSLENMEEDASYQTKVIIHFPSDLGYIGPVSAESIQCTSSYVNETAKTTCDVGNPFKGKTKKSLVIEFAASEITSNFVIYVEATSVNMDIHPDNNMIRLPVIAKYVTDLEISGISQPPEVIYYGKPLKVKDIEFQKDIGPEIIQSFLILNNGPSSVDWVEVSISVPHLYKKEDPESYLLYLINVELSGGAGRCAVTTNPLGIAAGNHTINTDEPTSNLIHKRLTSNIRMGCKSAVCYAFTCRVASLQAGDVIEVKITARLWQSTLLRAKVGLAELETTARLLLPWKVMQYNTTNDRAAVVLKASPSKAGGTAREDTPWWIYFLAILGGLLLLALAIALMYKFGFFERYRPEDEATDPEETKPMNV